MKGFDLVCVWSKISLCSLYVSLSVSLNVLISLYLSICINRYIYTFITLSLSLSRTHKLSLSPFLPLTIIKICFRYFYNYFFYSYYYHHHYHHYYICHDDILLNLSILFIIIETLERLRFSNSPPTDVIFVIFTQFSEFAIILFRSRAFHFFYIIFFVPWHNITLLKSSLSSSHIISCTFKSFSISSSDLIFLLSLLLTNHLLFLPSSHFFPFFFSPLFSPLFSLLSSFC